MEYIKKCVLIGFGINYKVLGVNIYNLYTETNFTFYDFLFKFIRKVTYQMYIID